MNLPNKHKKAQQERFPKPDQLNLNEKGQTIWDSLAEPTKYTLNRVMNCGLLGHQNLQTYFNEEDYFAIMDMSDYHSRLEQQERISQQLISIISKSRSKKKSLKG